MISTIKQLSNHEKTTAHLSQLINNPPYINFKQYFQHTSPQTCNLIKQLNATQLNATHYNAWPTRCWVQLVEHLSEKWDLLLYSKGNCSVFEQPISCNANHKVAGISKCSKAYFHSYTGKIWWFNKICKICTVYRVLVGYHELSGDWRLCKCEIIAACFWMHYQYDYIPGET